MKLQKNTWLLILLTTVLSAGVYWYEFRKDATEIASKTQQQQLFNLQEQDIQKIIIERPDITLEFVKLDNNTQSWQMKHPQSVTAEDGRISFLLDLFVNGKKERSFTVSQQQLSQYGLEQAIGKIIIETNNQKTQQIILGQPAIKPDTIYAQIITPQINNSNSPREIVIVSQNWQYAIEPELSQWINQN